MKYTNASSEDQESFKKGLEELLSKLSLHMRIEIVKIAVTVKTEDNQVRNVFADDTAIILQKIVEEPETPEVIEAEVVEPTVSPFIAQLDENNNQTTA